MIKITNIQIKKGILFSFSSFYEPLLLLIFTPIFIKNLTIEIYGLWILIFSLANFVKIGSSAVNSAVVKFLSNNQKKINKEKYLINIIIPFIFYSIILLLFLFFIDFLLDLNFLINFHLIDNFGNFLILSVTFILLKSFEDILLYIHISFENYTVNTLLKIISKTLLYISQIYCVIIFKDILLLIKISCIISLLTVIFNFYIIQKKYDLLRFKNFDIFLEFRKIKQILYYSKGLIINNIISIISTNIDKLIITFFLGLKVLGFYNISFLIYSFIHSFFSSFFFYLFPQISKIKNKKKRFKILIQSEKNINLFGTITIIFIFLISENFLKFFLANSYDVQITQYLKIFLIVNLLLLHTIPIYYFFMSLEETMIQAKISFYNFILSTFLLIFLGYYFSVYGIILSKLSTLIISFYAILYIIKFKEKL